MTDKGSGDTTDRRALWDQRYREAAPLVPLPAAVLQEYAHLLPARGRALDLACGRGGNALLLAAQGLAVDAWDLSPEAIRQLTAIARERGLKVAAEVRDVLQHPPVPASYDVITVSYFLERSLAPALAEALKPRGLLYYQTFGPDPSPDAGRAEGRGPRNPAYRLASGELLRLFPGLNPRLYRDDARTGEVLFIGERR